MSQPLDIDALHAEMIERVQVVIRKWNVLIFGVAAALTLSATIIIVRGYWIDIWLPIVQAGTLTWFFRERRHCRSLLGFFQFTDAPSSSTNRKATP